MGPLTLALYGLIVLFAGGDAAAHFTHYKYGETVSASIWAALKRFPVLHYLLGAAIVVLFTHLELRWP
jgi:hypothetical protein